MGKIEFKLPDIGEGVAEGEITSWKVKPGDAVKEDQVMVEVMTDKATVEIGSPVTGTVSPSWARSSTSFPSAGAPISTVALSVMTSTMSWSSLTVSPALTFQDVISPSATPSPMSGSLNSMFGIAPSL